MTRAERRILVGTVLAGLAVVASLLATAPTARGSQTNRESQLCGGLEATIHVAAGGGEINGTRGDDVIVADGDVGFTIKGRGGDDVICGSGGNDLIRGNGGNDIIYGGRGRDRLKGGGGDDTLYGEGGADRLNGGAGADGCDGGGSARDRTRRCEGAPGSVIEGLQDVGACKLSDPTPGGASLGFPRSSERIPTIGTVEIVVLFVDFTDVAASRSPADVLSMFSPAAEDFIDAASYGRTQVVLRPHLEWMTLSGPSTGYVTNTYSGHRAFIQEAIDLADPDVDFSGAVEVVVVSTPNAAAVRSARAAAWFGGAFTGGQFTPDGTSMTNAITVGSDLTAWGEFGYLVVAHEIGHSMTLVDLYSYSGFPGFTGEFSLMNDVGGEAPEHMAYERWLMGWLDDDQILCVGTESSATISPIEVRRGAKALIAPTGPTRAVVAESRRPLGYDSALAAPGVVVYLVDASIDTGSGAIEVVNARRALSVGDSVTIDGVTVTFTASDADGDTVTMAHGP